MPEYYYLNVQNVPQGPHSLDQLAELMASGKVNPTTLVACKGGTSWEPLGSVLSRENIATPELHLQPGQVGNCPSCGHDLAGNIKNGYLPAECPACGRQLWSGKPGIHFRKNFLMAFRNYATFTGRATRAEYWCFQFINALIYIALYPVLFVSLMVAVLSGAYSVTADKAKLLNADNQSADHDIIMNVLSGGQGFAPSVIVGVFFLLLMGWTLFTAIPQLSLTARRMHDVGWSAKWLIPYFIICAVPYLVLMPLDAMGELETENEVIQTITFIMGLLMLAAYVCGILLLVLTLLDSQRGVNKYGPSSKYPLG